MLIWTMCKREKEETNIAECHDDGHWIASIFYDRLEIEEEMVVYYLKNRIVGLTSTLFTVLQ